MIPDYKKGSTWRVILITALLTFLATTVLWVGGGALGYFLIMREPPDFHVTLEHPEVVAVGEEFDFLVSVENPSGKPLTLDSIDFYNSLLDGFEVVSADPRPASKGGILNFTTYYLGKKARSASSYDFKLRLRAKTSGFWEGDVDVCTVFGNFVTSYATIDVDPNLAPAGSASQADPAGE